MSKVVVDAGVCGFKAAVHARKTGDWSVAVRISSGCDMLTDMNSELAEVNWRKGVFGRIENCVIYQICSRHVRHTACPVPAAILKAIEVEAGLALPADVTMKIEGDHHE
jgi:hypothetical protein